MIPLYDTIPSRHPAVANWLRIGAHVLVFMYQLSPADPPLLRVLFFWPLFVQVPALFFLCYWLLVQVMSRELTAADRDTDAGRRLVELLSEGRITHDDRITAGVARDLGLPVPEDMPREFGRLMGLYPQRPAVECISAPYRKADER